MSTLFFLSQTTFPFCLKYYILYYFIYDCYSSPKDTYSTPSYLSR